MDIDLKVLDKITATAVQAAGMRDYDISPLLKRHVRPDGTMFDIDIHSPPAINELFDLKGCAYMYEDWRADGAEAYVSPTHIVIAHDNTRTAGHSFCTLVRSEAVDTIWAKQHVDLSPETFEKIAKLYFGADSSFINRIRKLQWKTESDTTTRLSSVSKSMDASEIAKVVDENQILFQDISLIVTTRYFVLPVETSPFNIELHVIANPVNKTIAFAPEPLMLLQAQHASMHEVRDALNKAIGENVVILGDPRMPDAKPKK